MHTRMQTVFKLKRKCWGFSSAARPQCRWVLSHSKVSECSDADIVRKKNFLPPIFIIFNSSSFLWPGPAPPSSPPPPWPILCDNHLDFQPIIPTFFSFSFIHLFSGSFSHTFGLIFFSLSSFHSPPPPSELPASSLFDPDLLALAWNKSISWPPALRRLILKPAGRPRC